MYPQLRTQWLLATSGVLVGGLVIKYLGFRNTPNEHIAANRFFKMCLWLQTGVAVTAVSTVILKLTNLSVYCERFPKFALIFSTIGLIKSCPRLGITQDPPALKAEDLCFSSIFWFMPSIYYCCFSFKTLEYSSIGFLYLITICLSLGTVLPLKQEYVSDLGLKIAVSSCCLLVIGILCQPFTNSSMSIIINGSLIMILSGVTIDDVQHLKLKYDQAAGVENIKPLKKSFTLFIESAIMFGRIAAFCDTYFSEENDLSTNQ